MGLCTLCNLGHSSSSSSKRYWYTIDGKLLSWSAEIKGEEVGFLHLGKVQEVTVQSNTIELKLKPSGKKKGQDTMTMMGTSDDPNVSNEQLMEGWKDALVRAITGEQAVATELKVLFHSR